MPRDTYKILAEKYQLINEDPLETEINPDGTHKTTHNVEMARTKARQAASVAHELSVLLEAMNTSAPLQAWMVTNVTQSADMLQDVLAVIKEENQTLSVEPVKETETEYYSDVEGQQ